MKKFSLADKGILMGSRTVFRVQAVASFGDVRKGDWGGCIEKEGNLSQEGKAWVSGNARVSGNAQVSKYQVINVLGCRWSITISDKHVQIGCVLRSIAQWEKMTDSRIKVLGYAEEIDWWHKHKDIVLALVANREVL